MEREKEKKTFLIVNFVVILDLIDKYFINMIKSDDNYFSLSPIEVLKKK
jgi:hypothetical protein